MADERKRCREPKGSVQEPKGSDTVLRVNRLSCEMRIEWRSRLEDAVDQQHELVHAGRDYGLGRQTCRLEPLSERAHQRIVLERN